MKYNNLREYGIHVIMVIGNHSILYHIHFIIKLYCEGYELKILKSILTGNYLYVYYW